MKIQAVIFSKDRAMQLDALLRSFYLHCQDAGKTRVNVIYKTSGAPHDRQYSLLAKEYPEVRFIPEVNFGEDLTTLLRKLRWPKIIEQFFSRMERLDRSKNIPFRLPGILFPARFILFLVDDALFVQDFSICQAARALRSTPAALGFSLRLGFNITYSYPIDCPQPLPVFNRLDEKTFSFNWTTSLFDFNYPLEVSSSLYRFTDIFHLLENGGFNNPNRLEGKMAGKSNRYTSSHPELLCFENSVAFCNPVNKVQDVENNRAGQSTDLASGELARLFDKGYRINIEKFKGFVPNACHQEVEFDYFKPGE